MYNVDLCVFLLSKKYGIVRKESIKLNDCSVLSRRISDLSSRYDQLVMVKINDGYTIVVVKGGVKHVITNLDEVRDVFRQSPSVQVHLIQLDREDSEGTLSLHMAGRVDAVLKGVTLMEHTDIQKVCETLNQYYHKLDQGRSLRGYYCELLVDTVGMSLAPIAFGIANYACMAIVSRDDQSFLGASPVIVTAWRAILLFSTTPLQPIIFYYSPKYACLQQDPDNPRIKQELRRLASASNIAALMLSLPAFIAFHYMKPILDGLGVPEEASQTSGTFFKALSWGVPGVGLYTSQQMLLISSGHIRVYLGFNILSSAVFVPMVYALSRGHAGMPDYGMRGYALAWSAYINLAVILIFSYTCCKKNLRVTVPRLSHISDHACWKIVRQVLWKGIFIGIQLDAEVVAFFCIVLFALQLGDDAAAVENVIDQILLAFTMTITQSARQATMKALSKALEEMKEVDKCLPSQSRRETQLKKRYFDAILRASRASTLTALTVWLLATAIPMYCIPKYLASPFVNINDPMNAHLIRKIETQYRIVATGQLFGTLREVQTGMINALQETVSPMLVSVLSLGAIGVPLAWVLANKTDLNLFGLELSMVVGMFIGSISLQRLWCRRMSKIEAGLRVSSTEMRPFSSSSLVVPEDVSQFPQTSVNREAPQSMMDTRYYTCAVQ